MRSLENAARPAGRCSTRTPTGPSLPTLTTALAVVALAACGGDAPAPDAAPPAAPAVVDVSAGDYFYTMADTVPAGATTFRLATNGQEMHHVQIVRLADGKTITDLMAEMHGEAPPAWAELVGGPNAPVPNADTSRVTLDLAPGNYAVLCIIPSPDGTPHVAKGMSKTLVVTPSGGSAPMPTPTVSMTLTDYDFALSSPLTAGAHVIEVKNGAAQPHEVFIAKLAPGATAMTLLEWMEKMEGPPPAMPMGGTVGLTQGRTNFVHIDLTPGQYAFFCFLPDAGDGKPHVAHGMVKEFTIE